MRRIGRRDDSWRTRQRRADAGTVATATATRTAGSANGGEGRWMRIWNETNMRARAWSRKHHGSTMNAMSWNALWERVRDELYGVAWACERARGFATVGAAREGVFA